MSSTEIHRKKTTKGKKSSSSTSEVVNKTLVLESEIELIRESLLVQKSLILNKTQEFIHEQTAVLEVSDEAEVVSQHISSNISIHLHERDRMALLQIERALCRIAEGSYDCCESCTESIGVRRLKARPFATLCIACMEEHEESKKNHFQ